MKKIIKEIITGVVSLNIKQSTIHHITKNLIKNELEMYTIHDRLRPLVEEMVRTHFKDIDKDLLRRVILEYLEKYQIRDIINIHLKQNAKN